jgi:hypothetical protein
MRTSFTIFALIISAAVGAFASPVGSGRSSFALCFSHFDNIPVDHLVKRGGPEICTTNLDGSGETDEQVTKDCCAAVKQQAYFNEAEKQCQPYGGHFGNSVDTGAMVQCCSSRNRGSRAV